MRPLHILTAVIVMVLWGCTFTTIHVAILDVPPFLLCSLRFFLASIPFVFFVKRPAVPFKLLMFYGLMMFAVQYCLFFFAMRLGMPAGLASLVYQINVFFTLLLAVLFFKEQLTRWQITGMIIAFLGLGIVTRHFDGQVTLIGFLLTIAGALAWAFGSIASKKIGSVNMIALVIWGNFISWPPLFLMTFFLEGPHQVIAAWQHASHETGFAILYIAYVSTLLCFSVWSWLLHRYPVTTVAPFTLLVPISGMICSSLITGEKVPLWKIIAGTLIIIGLMVHLFGGRLARLRSYIRAR